MRKLTSRLPVAFISLFTVLFFVFFPEFVKAEVTISLTPERLAKSSYYHDVELSPDGKHIAVVLTQQGKRKMFVFDTLNSQLKSQTEFVGKEEVGRIQWVNNERIVIQVMHNRTWSAEPEYYGELYATNFDGSYGRMIYSYRMGDKTGKGAIIGHAKVIDYMPNDEKHILIKSTLMSKARDRNSRIYKLNVYNGKLSRHLARSPSPYAEFYTDQNANIRLATFLDEDYRVRVYGFEKSSRTWYELKNLKVGNVFEPISFDKTGEWVYAISDHGQDKEGLVKAHLETGRQEMIYVDPEVDITHAITNSDHSEVYAVRVDPGFPSYIVFNKANEEAQLFRTLAQTFVGNKIDITSQSQDGNVSVVKVNSDINPGIYYLYKRGTNRLSILFDSLSHIDPTSLSKSEPMTYETRDGQRIHGYLTLPMSRKPKETVPMVTMVHGGPHGVRDFWLYDEEVQLLASQGYAVLRVNFRGSDGYGKAHWKAGHQRWGDVIQQDIIDGTRWALDNYPIDKNKLCIMGFSFGGYSAMQSSIVEPDLFKCAIASGGVFDLEMAFTKGDIPERGFGQSYLKMALGEDVEILRAFSPVHHASKLKANIMLAHGERDERVPFAQAEEMAKALDKANKPYRWFVREDEGHGFYNEQNRAAYFKEVVDFLKENLK